MAKEHSNSRTCIGFNLGVYLYRNMMGLSAFCQIFKMKHIFTIFLVKLLYLGRFSIHIKFILNSKQGIRNNLTFINITLLHCYA